MSVDDLSQCTLEICPIDEYGLLDYLPSVPGNALYIALFAAVILPQLYLGFRYKTWGYLIGMTGGLILEVLGYVSRILLHNNIFSLSFFVMNICCLTLGPAWFSAAIYVCLSRIIHIYGQELSPIRPTLMTFLFVSCDIISMSLQAVGGALTSSAPSDKIGDQGVDIMIAGLASQVATTVAFCAVCITIMINIKRNPHLVNPNSAELRNKTSFRWFLGAITTGTITILIRCCYRLAELSQGYESEIANDEVSFMILEGAMMVICVIALTVGHPGPILRDAWQVGKFRFGDLRSSKTRTDRPALKQVGSTDSGSGFDSEKTLAAGGGAPTTEKFNV